MVSKYSYDCMYHNQCQPWDNKVIKTIFNQIPPQNLLMHCFCVCLNHEMILLMFVWTSKFATNCFLRCSCARPALLLKRLTWVENYYFLWQFNSINLIWLTWWRIFQICLQINNQYTIMFFSVKKSTSWSSSLAARSTLGFTFFEIHWNMKLIWKEKEMESWNDEHREVWERKVTWRIVEGRLEFAKGSARWGIFAFLCKKLFLVFLFSSALKLFTTILHLGDRTTFVTFQCLIFLKSKTHFYLREKGKNTVEEGKWGLEDEFRWWVLEVSCLTAWGLPRLRLFPFQLTTTAAGGREGGYFVHY